MGCTARSSSGARRGAGHPADHRRGGDAGPRLRILTLLAETQAGYANLSRLISVGQLAGTKGAPALTIEDVAQHAEGLLCLSGCRQGAVAQAVLADDAGRARAPRASWRRSSAATGSGSSCSATGCRTTTG